MSGQQNTVQWRQVRSLVALDAAIIISWIAYHKYQPNVLEKFGQMHLTFLLVVAQAVILTLTPPIAGYISDLVNKKQGTRLPVFTVGVSVTAMIFMAVAFSISLPGDTAFVQAILPFAIILWIVSMNIFHSPALSTVELFVPRRQLPYVMSIITLVASLLYALEPSVVALINLFGAPLTFCVGGILVGGTGFFLRKALMGMKVQDSDVSAVRADTKPNFIMVAAFGLTTGLVETFLFNVYPTFLQGKLAVFVEGGVNGNYFSSVLIALSAVFAFASVKFVEKIGLQKFFWYAFGGGLVSVALVYLIGDGIMMLPFLIGVCASLGIMSVCGFPLVLDHINKRNVVLGTGLYFSGIELANGITEILQAL